MIIDTVGENSFFFDTSTETNFIHTYYKTEVFLQLWLSPFGYAAWLPEFLLVTVEIH
jgi:hypothetical protein